MPSTYSPILGIELIASGEQANTWGYTTNNNLGTLIEQGIAGQADIVMTSSSYTLSNIQGASDEARCMIINVSGVLATTGTVECPSVTKAYIVANNTSGGQDIEFTTSGGVPVIVPNGTSKLVFCDGVNTNEAVTAAEYFLLGNDPTEPMEAATKNYVDTTAVPITGNVAMTGPLFLPGSPTYTTEAVTKGYVDTNYLPVAGGTMTGGLYLPAAAPTVGTQAANKNYVDSAVAGGITGYVPSTRTISTTNGLTGGGNLTADRTLSLTTTGVSPGSYTSANIVVDSYGRISSASNGGGAGVTSVTAVAPLSSSGGSTPSISLSGTVAVANGGTGATTTSGALASLGALSTTGTAYNSDRLGNIAAALYVTSSSGTAYNSDRLGGTAASGYVTTGTLTATLGNYVTTGTLTTTLGSYVTTSALTTTLGSYLTTATAAATYYASGSSPSFGTVSASTINCTGNVTAYYTSDERLKENATPIADPLKKIRKLRGYNFDWSQDYIEREGGEDGYFVRKQDVGLLAQQLQAILPEAVAEKEDGYLGVQYHKVIPLLVEAVNAILDKLGVEDDA